MGQFPYGYEEDDVHRSPSIRQPGFQPGKFGLDLDTLQDDKYPQYKGYSASNIDKIRPHNLHDWSASSTRYLKLENVETSVPNTALFSYLQVVYFY